MHAYFTKDIYIYKMSHFNFYYFYFRVLDGTNAGGEKNPVCDVCLKIMPKLVLWEQVAKAGVVNAGY